MRPSPEEFVAIILVLFLGIGLHEYAHCKMADLAGDPTPRLYGRVTLNLFKHFEPMGSLFMLISAYAGHGLGWGRPAPMDPRKMHNPRWDWFVAVLAGPISNLAQAVIYALLLRLRIKMEGMPVDFLTQFLVMGVIVNIGLFMFNLIPFGPLDGHWLVGLLMPEKQRYYWFRFNSQVGMPGLFVLIMVLNFSSAQGGPDLLGAIFNGPVLKTFHFLTGLR